MRHHVVILGGSYGGIAAMRHLGKYPELKITLIDQHPYHFLQTEGYELISSNTSFDETIVSLPALCANYGNVTFKHRTVKSINPQKKVILLPDGICTYDTLIIALGSVTKRFDCDTTVYHYSSGAKSLRGALRLNQFFQDELYKRLESAKQAKENFNIIIGGAGLSGVEIAAGMQYFFNRYYKSNTLSCAALHIHLIASRETILNGMHPHIIKIASNRLEKLRVKVHTQSRIASIDNHEVILTDGSTIPFDFMIFAGGTMTAPCLETFNAEKNEKGQIIVDDFLKSNTYADIYVIGDAAALSSKKGKALPPTAQTAIQSGEIAAKNIIRSLHDKTLKKANIRMKGIAIALGGKYAAIDLGFIHFHGYSAYLVKKVTERLYKWPLWWLASKGYTKINSCEI
ncbi:FAD-dependent oxidoreductase [Sulfurovum sp.]|uniref:NAD(P)/FAD-dependent oxidoreductase n=1 Tax=Sulfurovum sp. TaxID=1969726 RepID=UPI0025E754FD|nr:FAD-dependent oxidoreductase [Sulfurovum sp.]